jgi:hypothetical protein
MLKRNATHGKLKRAKEQSAEKNCGKDEEDVQENAKTILDGLKEATLSFWECPEGLTCRKGSRCTSDKTKHRRKFREDNRRVSAAYFPNKTCQYRDFVYSWGRGEEH